MRLLCFIFLLAFLGVVGLFAYQNQDDINLLFWDRVITAPLPAVIGVVYLAGMFTGWTIVGMVRRTVNRVIETERT